MGMYPYERSLVKRMEGRPFALVGVNSDADREELRRVIARQGLTWRSFWDGGGTRGPIAKSWNVRAWPTLYVLDHEGRIRFKNLRDRDLDDAVDRLVAEAELAARR